MVDSSRFERTKNQCDITYPDILSSVAPVLHSEELFISRPPTKFFWRLKVKFLILNNVTYIGYTDEEEKQPHFPKQQELYDSIQNLVLTKSKARSF